MWGGGGGERLVGGGGGGGGDMEFQKRRDFASRSGAEILPYMGKWKIHGVYNFLYKKFSEHTWTKPCLQKDKQMARQKEGHADFNAPPSPNFLKIYL